MPFSTAGRYWPGITPPTILSSNRKTGAARLRFDIDPAIAELTPSHRTVSCFALNVGFPLMVFFIGNLGRIQIYLNNRIFFSSFQC